MKRIIQLVIVFTFSVTYAQEATQTIRGVVNDFFTNEGIPGAIVSIVNSDTTLRTITNNNGEYIFTYIPLGRWDIKVSSIAYSNYNLPNIMLTSGKEKIINVKLEEKNVNLDDVVIYFKHPKEEALNSMATISARTFSVEETERFAGSLGDPARMVSNYAGVMAGDDSRNDIVIRGNSPLGVLWRIEGVDIPNPNHFGAQGTTGGPVSMLNNNFLSNSDFMTGAFPAEYGNAISGVFDINLRSGNNSKHEFIGQVGFNGFEVGAEGPIFMGKGNEKGSYVIDYRYSTLDLMNKIGFDMGTGTAVPKYQDLTAIVDLPTKKAGKFKLITLMGKSNIVFGKDNFEINEEFVAHNDFGTATDFGANLLFTAATHSAVFSKKTKLKSSVSYNVSSSNTLVDTVDYVNKSYFKVYNGVLTESKTSVNTQLKHRFSVKSSLTFGIGADLYNTTFGDSSWVKEYGKYITVRKVEDAQSTLLKSYLAYQYKFSDYVLWNAGAYYQYYNLPNEHSLEPRSSIRFTLTKNQSFNLGYGLHSQIQSRTILFNKSYNETTGVYSENNKDLKSTKAHHYMIGYDNSFAKNFRVKVEAYFQDIFNVPISREQEQFSMLNLGSNYYIAAYDSLINKGKGKNYGVEFTLEKFFSKGYYFLFTASIFDSKYKGFDGKWRNTAFNSNYVFNILGGYEWKLGKKSYVTIDIKTALAGGRPYSSVDLTKSIESGYTEYDHSREFELRYDDYFRTDLRIGYKLNGKKVTQEWALDLQNITNQKNIFAESYNSYNYKVVKTYQQAFMPMMLYRITF